jgi:hypothetical protein
MEAVGLKGGSTARVCPLRRRAPARVYPTGGQEGGDGRLTDVQRGRRGGQTSWSTTASRGRVAAAPEVDEFDGFVFRVSGELRCEIGAAWWLMYRGKGARRARRGRGARWCGVLRQGRPPFIAGGRGRGVRSRSSMTMALRWFLGTGDDAPGSATSRRRRGA